MNPAAGGVRTLLRLEGLTVLLVSVAVFVHVGVLGWGWFALLLLVPDLSLLGYLAGPRIGAVVYNAAHTYIVPAMLGVFGAYSSETFLTAVAIIWVAHIGMDRAVGYGLKHTTSFNETHLGPVGRKAA